LQILRENTQNPQSISSDQSLVLIPIDAIPNIHERKREFKKRNKRASLSYQISKNTQTQSLSERERKTTTVGRKVIQFSGKS
jgi:phosphopentomutase